MSFSRQLIFIIVCLLLNGCVLTRSDSIDTTHSFEMSSWAYFSIQSSTTFLKRITRGDGSVAFTTYDTSTTTRTPTDYSVYIYPSVSAACTPAHLGNPTPQEIPAGQMQALWAKMLLLSAYDSYQNTFCQVFAPDCTDQELFEGTCNTKAATYAFCSEKDGKVVAICISQVTDNPQLAEEIFKTFRWRE